MFRIVSVVVRVVTCLLAGVGLLAVLGILTEMLDRGVFPRTPETPAAKAVVVEPDPTMDLSSERTWDDVLLQLGRLAEREDGRKAVPVASTATEEEKRRVAVALAKRLPSETRAFVLSTYAEIAEKYELPWQERQRLRRLVKAIIEAEVLEERTLENRIRLRMVHIAIDIELNRPQLDRGKLSKALRAFRELA